MVQVGDLDGIKKLTKNMDARDVVSMRRPGRKSILIFAIDSERLDIVKWLIQEKGADVNTKTDGEYPV